MREIKFRGWDEKNKEMVYNINLLFSNRLNDCFEEYEECGLKIMQYTGHKDKNGVEIYEGDIVRCWGGEQCQGFWEFNKIIIVDEITNPEVILSLTESENTESVGNIYENPELLR